MLYGNAEQRYGYLLARREQHVSFTRVGFLSHFMGQTNEPVRLSGHGRKHHHYVMTRVPRFDDTFSHRLDSLGIGHRRSAIFLNDERHCAYSTLTPLPCILRLQSKFFRLNDTY